MEQEESEQMITAIMRRGYLKLPAKKQAQFRDKLRQIISGEEESQNERTTNH